MVNLNAMVPVLFYLLQFLLIVRVCEEDGSVWWRRRQIASAFQNKKKNKKRISEKWANYQKLHKILTLKPIHKKCCLIFILRKQVL